MSIQVIRNWVYKRLTLKSGIVILICLGAISILYIIGSSFSSSERGPLESFAVGEMSGFRTVSEAPDLPDIMLTLQDNQQISLIDKKGKIILVNFWATWCAPCIVEMPSLNELEREFGSDLFEVLPVSLDASLVQAVNFYRDNKLDNLKVYHHGFGDAMVKAGIFALPISILYDPYGNEIGRLAGEADWSSPEATALIRQAISRFSVK